MKNTIITTCAATGFLILMAFLFGSTYVLRSNLPTYSTEVEAMTDAVMARMEARRGK
jgi:hypothetical protein